MDGHRMKNPEIEKAGCTRLIQRILDNKLEHKRCPDVPQFYMKCWGRSHLEESMLWWCIQVRGWD